MSGRLHLRAGDRAATGAAQSEGLALRRFIGDRVGEAATLHVQAQVALASAVPDGARVLLEKARAIVASQRGLIATPQLRATWAATTRRIDEDYVDVLMALHVVHPEAGFDGQALEASDSSQARSLLDVLTEPAGPPDAPASAPAAHERSVRGRLTTTLDRQVRARASRQPQPELDALADEVRQLSVEHQQAQAALRAADPRYAVLTRQEPLRLVDLQRQLLDADTTLIEFFLGDERGHAWVVGSDRLRSYELPARARIAAAVEAARRALSVPPADAAAAGAPRALRALADLVLPPDRGWLRGRRIVVVADGALHYVPFGRCPTRRDSRSSRASRSRTSPRHRWRRTAPGTGRASSRATRDRGGC